MCNQSDQEWAQKDGWTITDGNAIESSSGIVIPTAIDGVDVRLGVDKGGILTMDALSLIHTKIYWSHLFRNIRRWLFNLRGGTRHRQLSKDILITGERYRLTADILSDGKTFRRLKVTHADQKTK